ncbi:MAG: PBP1A family penicillin-binding protein [Parvularculaceae bacterium]
MSEPTDNDDPPKPEGDAEKPAAGDGASGGLEAGEEGASAAPDETPLKDTAADEFKAAADAFEKQLARRPKTAGPILPPPLRVEARRPPPKKPALEAPAPETSAATPDETPAESPVENQSPAGNENKGQKPAGAGAVEPPLAAPARRIGADGVPLLKDDMAKGDNKEEAGKRPDAAARAKSRHLLKPPKEKRPAKNPDARKALIRDFAGLAVSLGFVAAFAGLWAGFLVIAPWPDDKVDLWAVNRTPAIVIEDRNGREIAARGSRYGEKVSVADLPPYLVKAFLSTEDRRFYEHRGVDIRGTFRALLANIRHGGIVEGGSTITQQLARNLFLSADQNYVRKAKEAMLALWLEGRYTKDEILSLYLNRIYLGAGAYGIDSAAKTYFNKSAREVTLAEAAMLAGLPKAPSTLAPTLNPLGAQDRAKDVIKNLRETGAITEFDAREALRHPPVVDAGGEDRDTGWFFDYVAEKARVLAGPANYDIVVRTTLDQKLQRDAEHAVDGVLNVDAKVKGALQGALIAYDNDGAIRAMVGGRSYLESQFNRATQSKRQPGSSFKPIIYAAAFENGMTPRTLMVDQPIDIAGWKPTNYDNTYRGVMTLAEAVAKSINTIAVQVSEKTGRDKVIAMARRLGMTADIPSKEAGIALGGFSTSLDELAAAYIPFANGGMGVHPYGVISIADGQGKILYERKTPQRARVISEEVAKEITHVLYQVMTTGTGRGASLGGRPSAGKTGTTNDWRDAWFIGYTAQMTAGVWVGNDDFQPMDKVTGGSIPARIWKAFMIAAHTDLPIEPLDGAYLAISYSATAPLLSFYDEVTDGFERVRRDGARSWFDRR